MNMEGVGRGGNAPVRRVINELLAVNAPDADVMSVLGTNKATKKGTDEGTNNGAHQFYVKLTVAFQ
jgi:hypothetical protein